MPEGALRWVEKWRPAGNVWNALSFGGYLIWRRYPETRVFIDGRTARLYPSDFVRAAWRAESDAQAFAKLAHLWSAATALLGGDPARARREREMLARLDPGHPELGLLDWAIEHPDRGPALWNGTGRILEPLGGSADGDPGWSCRGRHLDDAPQ